MKRFIYVTLTLCVLTTAVAIAYQMFFSNSRYYLVQNKDGSAYQIDRRTGRTWHLDGREKREVSVRTPRALRAPITPKVMPKDLRDKVTCTLKYEQFPEQGTTRFELYNGTPWKVTDVTFSVARAKLFKVFVVLYPFSKKDSFVNTVTRAADFRLVEVRGHPPK